MSLNSLSQRFFSSSSLRGDVSEEDTGRDGDFDIRAKNETADALQQWRTSTLVLNASRRFRYVKDLDRQKELQERMQLKTLGVAAQAAFRFVHAGQVHPDEEAQEKAEKHGFSIDAHTLSTMVEKTDIRALREKRGVRGIANLLQVDPKLGLITKGEDSDLQKRVEVYGTNTYPEKKPKTFLRFVWESMHDLTLMVLGVCVVVSLIVGIATEGIESGWYDGTGIGFSIILVVLVTATSDYQQSLQFLELDKEKKKISIQVTRDDSREKVSIYDLVVGDIVHLSLGDQVPADGLLLEGNELTIDESSMTGESNPMRKSPEKPFLLSGTKVQDGGGKMLVIGVGMNTEWGHLMATLGGETDAETPLQVKLNGLATQIGILGLGVATLTFLVLLGRFFAHKVSASEALEWSDAVEIVNYFAIAVTIIVVAVPEGLPLAVTLTLAFAMKKMMLDKALVRHLAACETMGSATAICSDKTGTLTTNKMTVVKAWVAGAVRDIKGMKTQLSPTVRDTLIEHTYRNTSGDVGDVVGDGMPQLIGTPTETAVLGFGWNLGGSFRDVCKKYDVVKINPFNSQRKRMGVAVKHPDGHIRAHWKGASEIVLGMCDRYVDEEGNEVPLDEKKRNEVLSVISTFACEALRTLCLAYSDLDVHECSEVPEKNMVCLAVIGIKDPVRPGVPEAVKKCFAAGIKVRMVTGDNIETAKAIAKECGILTDGEAVEGPIFRTWDQREMDEKIPNIQVMARSSPTDKLTLVKNLRKAGEVVAVTGDGTNDAPALHEADIGMAMGIAGTEVAKESADVIVLDDNFSTIVVVAKWGRAVYTNIQKFVQFQLTVNIVALFTNFVSACLTGSAPLTAVQLLWVNLIMDTLGALALATEPPHDELLNKKSVGRKGAFISYIMMRNIIGQVIYQLIVLGVLQYKGSDILGIDTDTDAGQLLLDTMIFNTFVFCQVFNEINSREMEKLNVFAHTFGNWTFIAVVVFTVLFQWIIVTFLGAFADTVPLSGMQWLITVCIGAVSMPIAFFVKFIPVPPEAHEREPSSEADVPHSESRRATNGDLDEPLLNNDGHDVERGEYGR